MFTNYGTRLLLIVSINVWVTSGALFKAGSGLLIENSDQIFEGSGYIEEEHGEEFEDGKETESIKKPVNLGGIWHPSLEYLHPEGLRLGRISAEWVELHWKPPPLAGDMFVFYYTIKCFQPEWEQYIERVETRGNVTMLRLSGLEMGTMHQCEVRVSLSSLSFSLFNAILSDRLRQPRVRVGGQIISGLPEWLSI